MGTRVLYGPVGLRRFINTTLALSRSYLPYSYSVTELVPTEEQEQAAFRMTSAKNVDETTDECGCGSKEIPTTTLDYKSLLTIDESPVPPHPSEILESTGKNKVIAYDEKLGGYKLFGSSSPHKISATAVPIEHTIPSFGFLITEATKPGNLDAKRLRQDGLKPGPHYAKIKNGETVTFEGKSFAPEDYISPAKPGNSFIFLGDCNSTKPAVGCINLMNPGGNKMFIVHETTLENKLEEMAVMKGHSTPRMAAEFAMNVTGKAVSCTLLLDHFSQRYFDEDDEKRKEGDPSTGTLREEAERALEASKTNCAYKVIAAKDQLMVPLR